MSLLFVLYVFIAKLQEIHGSEPPTGESTCGSSDWSTACVRLDLDQCVRLKSTIVTIPTTTCVKHECVCGDACHSSCMGSNDCVTEDHVLDQEEECVEHECVCRVSWVTPVGVDGYNKLPDNTWSDNPNDQPISPTRYYKEGHGWQGGKYVWRKGMGKFPVLDDNGVSGFESVDRKDVQVLKVEEGCDIKWVDYKDGNDLPEGAVKAGCMNDGAEIYVARFKDVAYNYNVRKYQEHTVYGYYLHGSDGKDGGYFEFGDKGVRAAAGNEMEILILNQEKFDRPDMNQKTQF